ncbi:MAG TPA: hypothetical protein VGJ71_10380 [Candidatus Limnocylindrales bacterium]
MPADLLLPLFAVTLLANAFLVAAAIRSLRRGSGGAPSARLERPVGAPTRVAEPAARPSPAEHAATAAPVKPPEALDPSREARPPAPAGRSDEPRRTPRPQRPAKTSAANAVSTGEPRRRGRRRFSLPPLDDDHEKVSRSIESFLAGIDVTEAAPGAGSMDADPGAGHDLTQSGARRSAGAQTIALVAVAGIAVAERPAVPRRNGRATRRPDDDATIEDALAVVERSIRGAARATDVVSVGSGGVFRIDLPETGELAARAYLRRVRATVDPVLETSERPLRLAVATATMLDEPIRNAVARAEHRLIAALDAADHADLDARHVIDVAALDDPAPERRAAAD